MTLVVAGISLAGAGHGVASGGRRGDGERVDQIYVDDIIEEGNLSERDKQAGEGTMHVLKGGEQHQRGPQRHQQKEQRGRILRAIQERQDRERRSARLHRPWMRIAVEIARAQRHESKQRRQRPGEG